MKLLMLLLATGLWSSWALADGFTAGDQFKYTELQGTVNLHCFGNGSSWRTVYCDGYVVDPATHSYYHTDNKVDANKVELRVTRPNGKVVKKRSRFDAKTGRSKKAFNLGVWSLFQRPLLHLGNNDVYYSLTSNNKSVREGSFRVRLEDMGVRQCRTRTMTSHDSTDCDTPGGGGVCSRYFDLENNCEY